MRQRESQRRNLDAGICDPPSQRRSAISFGCTLGTAEIFGGLRLDPLREILDKAPSTERRMADIFMRPDVVPLTPELVAQSVAEGMSRQMLEQGMQNGASYSPSRHSILYPPVSSEGDG